MLRRALFVGIGLWVLGTIVFRFSGAGVLRPPSLARTVPLYVVNFVLAAIVVRVAFPWLGLPRERWPAAVTLFILPTLVLDAFTTAFFPSVFPNLAAASAPTFGGLMLISTAGAVASAWVFGR